MLGISETLRQALFLAALIPLAFVPFAFLTGLLRSRISRAEAVGDLVAGLAASGEGPDLRDALADALSDPSSSSSYWVPRPPPTSTPRARRSGCPAPTLSGVGRR